MSATVPGIESGAARRMGAGKYARGVRLAIGAVLLALAVLPVYRLLDPLETGLAGYQTVRLLDIYHDFSMSGLLLVLPIAIVAARLVSPEAFRRFTQHWDAQLLAPGTGTYVLACALLGSVLTAAFSLLVLEGKPNNIDAFAQLLQARYWAAGMLAGPTNELAPFWAIQNSVFTPDGWVSQYPPGHILLVTPFLMIGAAWLLGPLLVFTAILCTGLFAHRIFENDPVVARVGTGLLSISPFFLFVSGSLMNHVTTVACLALGMYALVRAWQDGGGWALAAGASFALALATRPLSTLATGLTLALLLPVLWPRPARRLFHVAALGIAGTVPVLSAWFLYNAHFFGSPLRTGYSVALGPSMALGFHRDPWGNFYGPVQALAYTSADVTMLGVNVFETPVSAVVIIGLFLVVARRLGRGASLLLALAIAPVVANAFYWHHGPYMGPRMLHEASPAWVLLFAASLVGLGRRIPERASVAQRYFLRPAFGVTMIASFAIGLIFLAPRRALSYGGDWLSVARTPMPQPGSGALIFVHDAWKARIGMTLAGRGVRLDLVETLIRQNSTCRVNELADALFEGDEARAHALLATLDTVPRSDRLPLAVEIVRGDRIRMNRGETLTRQCRREALSDRFGILDIAPLLWQAGVYAGNGGPLIARDLGPEKNALLIRAYPDRRPYVYVAGSDSAGSQLHPYDPAMRRLWFPSDSVTLRLQLLNRPFER